MSRQWTKMLGAMLLFPILALGQTSKPLTEEMTSSTEIILSAITGSEDKILTVAQTYVDQLNENVIDAALASEAEYRKRNAVDPKVHIGTENEIPPEYWNDTLRSLNPVRVYHNRSNIFIALKRQDGIEEGVYIYQLISSFAPMPGYQTSDGFTFYNPRKGNMINYRRDTRFFIVPKF